MNIFKINLKYMEYILTSNDAISCVDPAVGSMHFRADWNHLYFYKIKTV